jgi:hypothetical protein
MVIGGGDSAMEEANFLTRFGSEVAVVHRRDQFRASKIMLDRARHNPKIKFFPNTVVEEIYDAQQHLVTAVRLKNLETGAVWEQEVDGFFVAIGTFRIRLYLRARSTRTPTATLFPKAAPGPIFQAYFTPVTCRTASTGRLSPHRPRAAWQPWRPSGFWKRRDFKP